VRHVPEPAEQVAERPARGGVQAVAAVEGEDLEGVHKATDYLVRGNLKYVWLAKHNEEQLFDLADDPRELHDLSADAAALAPFRAALADHLRATGQAAPDAAALRPCAGKPPEVFWGKR